jgi:hypothetical protein
MQVWDWNLVHVDWEQGTVVVNGGYQTNIEMLGRYRSMAPNRS